jgi:hypothetical protein
MAHLAIPLATPMRSAVRIERSMTACHHTAFSVASPIPSHVHDFTDSHLQAQRYIALLRIKKKQLKKLKLQAPCRNHWICLVFIFFDSSNLYQEPSEKLTYEAQHKQGDDAQHRKMISYRVLAPWGTTYCLLFKWLVYKGVISYWKLPPKCQMLDETST